LSLLPMARPSHPGEHSTDLIQRRAKTYKEIRPQQFDSFGGSIA
jgi:hypothetical protein